MTELAAIIIVLVVAIALAVSAFFIRRRPRRLKVEYYQQRWRALQKMCADKKNWTEAIRSADDLLAQALKKKGVAGKSVGERLVNVQRELSDNDGVWFGHKLRGQLDAKPNLRLKEQDVKNALLGIRQALRDLGALPNAERKK